MFLKALSESKGPNLSFESKIVEISDHRGDLVLRLLRSCRL